MEESELSSVEGSKQVKKLVLDRTSESATL
jgi:hypothetical protein